MWWLIPAAVTIASFVLARRLILASRSEWGTLLVGVADAVLIAAATIVTLIAWLVYFIVN